MAKLAEIKKLDRGTRETKSGKTQEGVWVEFYNPEKDRVKKEFLTDYHNKDLIKVLEEVGVGGNVMIGYKQNNGFWNLNTVEKVSGSSGGGSSSSGSSPSAGSKPASKSGGGGYQKKGGEFRQPDEIIRTSALAQSIDLTKAMLEAPDRFKKLTTPTKLTPELLVSLTLDNAVKFEGYIKGNYKSTVESDNSDLNPAGAEMEQPDMPDPNEE